MYKFLKKKNFLNLVKNQKKILFSNYSNFYTYCIATLYINRSTFDCKNESKYKKFFFINNFLFILKGIFILFLRLLLNNSRIYKKVKNLDTKKNILIISNVINENINKDLYFGNLTELINKKNYFNCIKIFKNLSDVDESILWKNLTKKNNTIILPKITNFINEIYFLFIFLSQYLRLKFLISIDKIKVDLNYRYLISFRNLLSILPTLRLCYEIKKIISIYSPKIILFTFEGHAWERALIKTIRDIDENIFIVAYQFSPITKFHYSIFYDYNKIYLPNLIANSGNITNHIFKKIYKNKIQCKILGSSKYRNVIIKQKKDIQILICPENLPHQLNEMLSISIKLSNYYKNIKFRFRFHPTIDAYSKFNYLKKIKDIESNLIISTDSLNNELIRCSHIIYRSTAVSIEALSYGVLPIYLNTFNRGIDENPLFFNQKLFFTLNKISDLNNIIKCKRNLSVYPTYAKKYFSKFKLNFFNSIIKSE